MLMSCPAAIAMVPAPRHFWINAMNIGADCQSSDCASGLFDGEVIGLSSDNASGFLAADLECALWAFTAAGCFSHRHHAVSGLVEN